MKIFGWYIIITEAEPPSYYQQKFNHKISV